MLNSYLNDPTQLERAMSNSPSEHKKGFKLFGLDPVEKQITYKLAQENKKQIKFARDDPFYTKYRASYQQENKMNDTGNILNRIHRQLNFKELR